MADRARRRSEQRRARRIGAARQSRNAARRRANDRVRKQVEARKRSFGKAKKVGTKSAINSSKPKNVSKRMPNQIPDGVVAIPSAMRKRRRSR